MMSQTQWAAWSVEEFFSGYNWTGIPPKFAPLEPTEERVEANFWLCGSVRDFLKQSNWTGQPLAKSQPDSQVPPVSSVTRSVNEFFRLMVWEGNSEIVSTPTIAPTPTPMPVSISIPNQDLNLNHLSDLF